MVSLHGHDGEWLCGASSLHKAPLIPVLCVTGEPRLRLVGAGMVYPLIYLPLLVVCVPVRCLACRLFA